MSTEEGSAIESSNGTPEDALTALVAATVSPDTVLVDSDVPTGITPPDTLIAPLATDPPQNANMNPQIALIMEQELKEAKDTIKQMGTALEQFHVKVVQLENQAATGIDFSMFPKFLNLV